MAKKETKETEEEEKKEGAEGGDAAPAEGEAKKSSKKMMIIIAAAAVVLIGGIVAALFFTGVIGPKKPEAGKEQVDGMPPGAAGKESAPAKAEKKEGAVFYDLGEIVVNLQADGRRQTFLKLVVQLELESDEDKKAIEGLKPRIVDNFQTYLRELRMDDLRGSAGLYRLREELLFRVTEAAHPIKVKDVLFQQMLVQ